MDLIYGEISIDSTNRIVLPKILNLEAKKLDLLMLSDYVLVLFPFESDKYMEKKYNDTNITIKERNDKLRLFSKNCIPVEVDVSSDGTKRINLTSKLVLRYNLEKKIIYEIGDGGRILLWNPNSFEKYRNELMERKVKKK